jgi:hypothetical protein
MRRLRRRDPEKAPGQAITLLATTWLKWEIASVMAPLRLRSTQREAPFPRNDIR